MLQRGDVVTFGPSGEGAAARFMERFRGFCSYIGKRFVVVNPHSHVGDSELVGVTTPLNTQKVFGLPREGIRKTA